MPEEIFLQAIEEHAKTPPPHPKHSAHSFSAYQEHEMADLSEAAKYLFNSNPNPSNNSTLTSSVWREHQWVWVEDAQEGFIPARKLADGSSLELQDSARHILHSANNYEDRRVLPMNSSTHTSSDSGSPSSASSWYDRVEDMADLVELNEATVFHNLRRRYAAGLIHTWSGLFLVVINPYRDLPIYGPEVLHWYASHQAADSRASKHSAMDDGSVEPRVVPSKPVPHIFAVAEEAYRAMLSTRSSQSILITGESGAGKTENTKRVIQYLTAISLLHHKHTLNPNDGKQKNGPCSIENALLLTNPILEAFGNAMTRRNNNSSRFGKFIRIAFSSNNGSSSDQNITNSNGSQGEMLGVTLESFLLEKGRVTHRDPQERSFHVFYGLCSDPRLIEKFHLKPEPSRHRLLNFSMCSVDGIDDAAQFATLQVKTHRNFSGLSIFISLVV